MDQPRIAIVGAGVAGLAAAWRLRDAPVQVEVFEKSRGVSGRAASRSRHGARFDFGANYFKLESPGQERLVLGELPQDDLVRIAAEVWTFDARGKIEPGDPVQNREARWTYGGGISTLGKLLAAAAQCAVHRQCRITGLQRQGGRWALTSEPAGETRGKLFDAVLLTVPGPQAMTLLAGSALGEASADDFVRALAQARYHGQLCFALGFREPVQRPQNCFALINRDRAHDIAWLSFENDKPRRELGGHTVMMVQMSPDWSARHLEQAPAGLVEYAAESALAVLAQPPRRPDWFDSHRWAYAHPWQAADRGPLQAGARSGLHFAGDALVGKGRIGETLQTGLDAAEQILAGSC